MKIRLTRKQSMVFDLIMRGWRAAAIARSLSVTEKCVKYHKTNIFKLCGVSSTFELHDKYKDKDLT